MSVGRKDKVTVQGFFSRPSRALGQNYRRAFYFLVTADMRISYFMRFSSIVWTVSQFSFVILKFTAMLRFLLVLLYAMADGNLSNKG